MFKLIKCGLSLFLSGSILCSSPVMANSDFLQNEIKDTSINSVEDVKMISLSTPTEDMNDTEKLEYFENIYSDFSINTCNIESREISKKIDEDVKMISLSTPTEDMNDTEKLKYFENIYSDDEYVNYNTINVNPNVRGAYAPSATSFYNLSVHDYEGSGSFTANYLYTNKCFAPNDDNNLVIRGTAGAEPSSDTMYISVYDVSDPSWPKDFPVYSVAYNDTIDRSYFDYAFAIGPLNPDHLYAVRFSPASAMPQYDVFFTVSHS